MCDASCLPKLNLLYNCFEIIEPLNRCVKKTETMGSCVYIMNSNWIIFTHMLHREHRNPVSYNKPVFLSSFTGKVKVMISFRACAKGGMGREEVQYCGDTVEKSCINLMFGSTVAEKFLSAAVAANRLVLAPFQPTYFIINSSLLAVLYNCGQ